MSDTKHQGAPGRGGSDPDHPVDRGVAGSGHERVDENRPRRTDTEAATADPTHLQAVNLLPTMKRSPDRYDTTSARDFVTLHAR